MAAVTEPRSTSFPTLTFRAAPEDRARLSRRTPIGRSALLLAGVLLLHAVPIGAILLFDRLAPKGDAEQEISVDVVTEPPPPAQTPPPPAPQPQAEQKPPEPEKPKPEPQKQKLTMDDKPAFDAPRAENKETVKREAPDEATKAMRLARPEDRTAEKPTADPRQKPQQERQPDPSKEEGATPEAKEEPLEAEVIARVAPHPTEKPKEKPGRPDPKAALGERQKSIAEQIASLEPVPQYMLGGSAKSSPVTGGTADPTYFSVVYGLIMRKFHPPSDPRRENGFISFYVDPSGNLTHQAVRKSSGSSARDQEALAALRRAAPFPPPPTGSSVGLVWQY